MLRPQDSELADAIGRRARALRERLSLTQEEVAEEADLSPQVYARLERGGVLPSVASLVRLCATLQASPNDLLGDAPVPPAAAKDRPQAPDVMRLARATTRLGLAEARLLLPLVRRLTATKKRERPKRT